MPRLRFCCLPGGLRWLVSAGRRRLPLGGGPGPVRRRGGLRPGGRAGGRRGPPAPPPPLSPGSSGPDSRLPSLAAPWSSTPGGGGRPGAAGKGDHRPSSQPGGRREAGQGGLQCGGIWRLEAPRWPGAAGCGLQPRGWGDFSCPGPGPPMERASERGAEEGSGEGEHLYPAFYPSQRPSLFHCRADCGLLSKEQLLDSWQNNRDPASLGPLLLGQKMRG